MGERNVAIAGILIAIGLAVGGYFIGNGLLQARSADRHVTVKGLAEREVAANLVIWPKSEFSGYTSTEIRFQLSVFRC